MTGPMIFTPEYYERMRKLESSGWWNAGMRDVAARMLRAADLPPAGRMLDIGCGSGQTMTWFRELNPGWETIGFDVAMEGLRAARHFGEEGTFAGSALEIPLPSGSVDAIVTLDVLQHLPLPSGDMTALKEMLRVLSPGGHLFIRTNAQSFPVTADDPTYNFHKYRSTELSQKLRGIGFDVVRLSRINSLLGLAEIPRELRATRNSGDGYHGLLAETTVRPDRIAPLKRGWLGIEARTVALGLRLPFGRTLIALCRKPL